MAKSPLTFSMTAIVLLGCALGSGAASAQADQMAGAHNSAANQLGILEYCKAEGFIGDEPIAAERSMITRLPASSASTDAAEALGKKGTLSAGGTTMTLAAMASGHNTSVEAVCKQMGSSTMQTAAAFSGSGAMGMPSMPGGMPAMPTMPSEMPAMPSGMPSMPAMPGGMPSMPGAPATK